MNAERDTPIVFVVSGQAQAVDAGVTRAAAPSRAGLPAGRIKQSVRVGTERGGSIVRMTAVPGEDVVVLHIAGGPSLILHPDNARDLMLSQGGPRAGRGEGSEREAIAGEVGIPMRLRWQGLDRGGGPGDAQRGFLGDVVLAAVEVVTGLATDGAAKFAASAVVRAFDEQVDEGVYRLRPDSLLKLKGRSEPISNIPARSDGGPLLVFVHGTFSDTAGTFGKLWTDHPQLVRSLFKTFGDQVYALDHRTLGRSPIANALTLANALPSQARARLVTHSRGGLVAEVLARVSARRSDVFEAFAGAGYEDQRKDLAALSKIAKEKEIRIERVVRVACPARGTLLASKRLDAYLSVFKWSLELAGIPVATQLLELLGAVAKRRADPTQLPGLAAQIPDSPLVTWLHAADEPVPGELRVVAGDIEGDSVASWLKTLVSDAFYWTDNDLVVQTRSMYGGAPRADGASFVLDQGGKVSHFNYFSNERTAQAIVAALAAPAGDAPQAFRVIGPMSLAGESSTGVRAAAPAVRDATPAGERPAVFVLPGIVGSHLKVDGKRIWLTWRLIGGLDRLKYELDAPDGVQPDGPVGKVYDKLSAFLASTHEVVEFAFDWRRPIEDEARRLADAVDAALDARATSGQPVRIVAHSMGGIVARTMQLERPEVWRRMMSAPGARLLMLGTPNGGSWAPMQVLSGDDTFGNALVLFGAPFRDHAARQILAAFPGLLQLQAALLDPARALSRTETWKQLAEEDLRRSLEHAGWHHLELQRHASAWGVPPQEVLDRAVALRRRLDSQIDTDLAEFADRMLLVVGKARFTPDGYETGANGLVYLDAPDDGDGRVPLRSALLPGVRTWSFDAKHGELPSKDEAFEAYEQLLRNGTTSLLAPLTAASARGASSTSARRSRPARSSTAAPPPESAEDLFAIGGDEPRDARRAAPVPALRVTVHNGDLTFERRPVMLGHYRSSRLTGTERVMDRMIGGLMKDALALGLYPDLPGTHQIFVNTRADPEDPRQMPRPEAVIVAGLGPEGSLGAAAVSKTVCQAVIGWAQRVAERSDGAPPAFELAATLLGSGGIGISAGEAARLIAQGVYDANVRFAVEGRTRTSWPAVSHLHLVELYADRASEAWRALRLQEEATPERIVVTETVRSGAGALRRPPEFGYRGADYDLVTALTVTGKDGEPVIVYSVDSRRARTEVRGQKTQGELLRPLIARASNDSDAGSSLGRTLFRLLVPVETEPFLAGTSAIQLVLDAGTAGIPWELLDAPSGGSHDAPWAIRAKLVRKLTIESPRERVVDADPDARVLVIGEPKCDATIYPRLPGARAEARAVVDRLTARDGLPADRVASLISPDEPKAFGADAEAVVKTLLANDWRIVHIAGHGEPPQPDDPRGVVLSDKAFLGPREIGRMRVVPELVFVNCCYSGARQASQLLRNDASELGRPYDRAGFAAGVAEKLIEIGVRCVVVTGWAVDDEAAMTFAGAFYDALLRGERFIEAVSQARLAAHDKRGNTWAAYQCYGDPDWTLRREGSDAQRPEQPLGGEYAGIATPASLKLALEALAVTSRFQRADAEDQRMKLRYLESQFEPLGRGSGEIAEAFATAWAELGDRAIAIGWYEKAVAAEDASASIKAAEQLANARVRLAWDTVSTALESLAGKQLATTLDAGRASIAAAIELLETLLELHPSMERESLCGSAYKRLALIEAAVGRSAAEKKAVGMMLEHYRQAETIGRTGGNADFFYPALNRMAAALALEDGSHRAAGFDATSVEAVRLALETKARDDADFWCIAGQTELRLYEALAARRLATDRPKLQRAFEELHARVRSKRMWGSVADNARFILPRYGEREGGKEALAAERLLSFLEGLVART